ncbi:MAG: SDR family oxidoreductase [Planctomycetes bacterium]|nr:SDR family oxidoreductase [Planctomycetota bacterium]
MSRCVLVTGGAGYVGSRLIPHLLEQGHSVRSIDLDMYGTAGRDALERDPRWGEWKERFVHVRGDVREPKDVRAALDGADAVIHLAAISNDPTGEVDEVLTRQVNFDSVGLLVAEARRAGVTRFVNASSSSVFGIKDEPDVIETLEPEPISTYSRYKALAEWIVVCANSPEFTTVNVRPATVCGYSPRQRFDLTVNKLTVDAVRKGVITVHGGQQRRPNVSMIDVINLYGLLLEADPALIGGETFNFGFENHKIIEIAEIIRGEITDRDVTIDVTAVYDQRDYHISSQRLVERLGYTPVGSIRQAVAELRAHLDEFPDPDGAEHHNMKSMKLARNAAPYGFLAGVDRG